MAFSIPLSTMPPLVREFASYKVTIQGCAEKTVDQYLHDLRMFFRFLVCKSKDLEPKAENFEKISLSTLDEAYMAGITTSDIYEFFMYISNDRENRWCARARKLSAVKAFFKFLVHKKHLFEVDPSANIESPKRKQTLPKFLTIEESMALLNAISNDVDSPFRERDYCIVTLFLNCGMRLAELVGISLNDLDADLRSLRVVGKGSKERIVYLNDACRDAIRAYLEIRKSPKYDHISTNALFISKQYKRISDKTVQWLVYKYLGMAGLDYKHYSTHKLRHTAATLMYQTGEVDIRVLKEILGHEQLNTTQIYTHVSNAGMEKAVNANPLADVTLKRRGRPPKIRPEENPDEE